MNSPLNLQHTSYPLYTRDRCENAYTQTPVVLLQWLWWQSSHYAIFHTTNTTHQRKSDHHYIIRYNSIHWSIFDKEEHIGILDNRRQPHSWPYVKEDFICSFSCFRPSWIFWCYGLLPEQPPLWQSWLSYSWRVKASHLWLQDKKIILFCIPSH